MNDPLEGFPFTSPFPRFGDGDVLTRLSEKADDTLQLHSEVLARNSGFFKTSLSDERWSDNKVFVSKSGVSFKLLELTFDDPEILPGLLGRTEKTPREIFRHQRAVYDGKVKCGEKDDHEIDSALDSSPESDLGGSSPRSSASAVQSSHELLTPSQSLTPDRPTSQMAILAHKTLFAMVYDLTIDIETSDVQKMAILIPTVVALADAYAMLPRFGSKIHELLFSGNNGFNVIAHCPFSMLKVACKLRSKAIYHHAMRHAVGLRALILQVKDDTGDDEDEPDGTYFAQEGENELQEAFDKHVKALRRQMKTLNRQLLNVGSCGPSSEIARSIATAVWRSWMVENISTAHDGGHQGIHAMANQNIDVARQLERWADRDWMPRLGQQYRHEDGTYSRHQALGGKIVQAMVEIQWQARSALDSMFPISDYAKGDLRRGTIHGVDV
ncbi:hypothetical protein KC332_g8220 [Hortaea werneckii]|nr:hypothetical protein KC350_g5653 [Hortaea werneckii]KAI6849383.1 hypothetical protein KC358_g1184 [Hortaea werneckii]KAI6943743.1 hypothetical protein KC341_g1281 [Hortaea werneckii]KAI6945685.1 hypothetical protein KC348_g3650 [Hortaea werneckii]KAI6981709.1 hypothetical protein KC321_g1051 [Hortaea werneckii]